MVLEALSNASELVEASTVHKWKTATFTMVTNLLRNLDRLRPTDVHVDGRLDILLLCQVEYELQDWLLHITDSVQ